MSDALSVNLKPAQGALELVDQDIASGHGGGPKRNTETTLVLELPLCPREPEISSRTD
jgi:hypothetical protein